MAAGHDARARGASGGEAAKPQRKKTAQAAQKKRPLRAARRLSQNGEQTLPTPPPRGWARWSGQPLGLEPLLLPCVQRVCIHSWQL